MRRHRRFLAAFLMWLLAAAAAVPAIAQEDAYHGWLRAWLDQEYGVTGGSWTLSEQESSTLSLAMPTGVQTQTFVPAGQVFARGLRITSSQPSADPWDRTVRFRNQQPIRADDVLLLVVWLRHTWPPDENGLVGPVFELAVSPYTKSLSAGYTFEDGEWELFLVPFRAVMDYGVQEGHFQLNVGYQRQIIELGGLALLNYGASRQADDLPELVPEGTYQGRDPNAPWRAEAQSRIEQVRKGTVRVVVRDGSGEPVAGVPVRVRMTGHKFGFGTAVAVGRMIGPGFNPTYRSNLINLTGDGRGFNWSVLENALKWPAWESGWPVPAEDKITVVRWLRDHGLEVRGHNIIWPGWQFLPGDLEANRENLDYITNRIQDRIAEIAGYPGLKGVLRDWDVINEAVHVTNLRDVFRGTPGYVTGEEVYAEWFELAREADPDARLFLNDYSIISRYGAATPDRLEFKRLIRNLQFAGAPLGGIGLQGHMGVPLTPPDTLYKVFEEFAEFGVPLSVTEYDAAGVGEALAADYLRDFLTVAFSHDAVESVLMWGFWDGAHHAGDAPLFRSDWSLKPAGQAFLDLVFGEWWTDVEGVTDSGGSFATDAFLGSYEVTAAFDGAVVVQQGSLSSAGGRLEVTVLATDVDTPNARPAFKVGNSYPNPFLESTTIPYSLSNPARVRLDVFDATGRKVYSEDVGVQPGGTHQVRFERGSLPAGLYLYSVRAGADSSDGKMVVLP